jgi:hypothetical protein
MGWPSLIINYFVLGDQVVVTPTFLGAEPVHAKTGKYAGLRVFKADEDRGLALVRALSEAQRAKTRPKTSGEDFTTAFRDNLDLNYAGIRYDELSNKQHDVLLQLVKYHVGRTCDGHAEIKMAEVKRHLKETYFCWMGGIEDDSTFYYRVQSPVIIVEFDHQRGIAFREHRRPYKDHIHVFVRTHFDFWGVKVVESEIVKLVVRPADGPRPIRSPIACAPQRRPVP